MDDAIVIGENIYAHMQLGKPRLQAAVEGTTEVMPSVTASVTTTVIAFAPMFFVSGVMGKFMAVIPFAVIAMLVISLWESIFVLAVPSGAQTRWVLSLRFDLDLSAATSRARACVGQQATPGAG